MIAILVREGFAKPVEQYLDGWAPEQREMIEILHYEKLAWQRRFRAGTYVFGDLERLTDRQLAVATGLAAELQEAGTGFRVLNHPGRVLRRYELLRRLHEDGVNDFNAYRVSSHERPKQYPVFLRLANRHNGARSRLLEGPDELERAIGVRLMEGADPDELIIVEFCDTSAGRGVFTVRTCFRVGERIFPHHMHRGSHWVVKSSHSGDHGAEELRFLRSRACSKLRGVFDLAGIEYGRMDYGLLDGRVQVFEINTNPVVLRDPRTGKRHPVTEEGGMLVAQKLKAAFSAINLEPRASRRLEFDGASLAARAVGSSQSPSSRRGGRRTSARR